MKDLTPKQQAFCEYYVETGNITESAKRAGYSEKTGFSTGHKLLQKDKIVKQIREYSKGIKTKRIADSTEVLETLTTIARGESKDQNVVTEKVPKYITVKDKNGKDKKKLMYTDVTSIYESSTNTSDRVRALQLLGKRYVLFTDKHDVDAKVSPVQIVNDVPKEDEEGDKDD